MPAHGLPIAGAARIATVLDDIATALGEPCVADVIAMMNARRHARRDHPHGAVPGDTLAKPYLRPLYDEPEFVVRNVWRQFGGWWDGAASRLKPSPDAQRRGCDRRAVRWRRRADAGAPSKRSADGDLRLACHLADLAGWAAPDDGVDPRARGRVYLQRRKAEPSLMSKGIFMAAARESQVVVERSTP